MFAQGEIRWAAWTGSFVAVAVTAVAIAAALVSYRGGARLTVRDRMVLTALRVALLLLVLVCLFRPRARRQGRGAAAELRRRAAGRLAQHADCRRRRPAARVVRARSSSAPPIAALLKALSDGSWSARSASRRARRRASTPESDLTFGGTQTRLGAALDGARQELAGLPLAGPGDGQRRRRHGRRRAGRRAARPQGRGRAGLHRRRRPRDARRTTSRSAASTRRAPRSRARR